jgi:hypothetical protein
MRVRHHKFIALVLPLVFASALRAQNPAGWGSTVSVDAGYSYLSLDRPQANRIGSNGAEVGASIAVSQRISVRAEVGYARASNTFSSGHHADVLSYLAGPVVYPLRPRKIDLFGEFLLGGARVTGVAVTSSGTLLEGYAIRFAWSLAAGAETRISDRIGLRTEAGLLHTAFFGPNTQVTGQRNFRVGVGVVLHLGSRAEGFRTTKARNK